MVFASKTIGVAVASLNGAAEAAIVGVPGYNVAVQIGIPCGGGVAICVVAPVAFNMVLEVFLQAIEFLKYRSFPLAAGPGAAINPLMLCGLNQAVKMLIMVVGQLFFFAKAQVFARRPGASQCHRRPFGQKMVEAGAGRISGGTTQIGSTTAALLASV
jgi:hypothetical protein